MPSWKQELIAQGVIAVPTKLTDARMRADARRRVLEHFERAPEFFEPDPANPKWKPVLGGFACCGHPSSFHDEEIRKLREQMTAEMIHLNILPMNPSEKLEKVFDRILYRVAGETPTAESWHRDEAPTALETDTVFGGWINLNDYDEYFNCVPGTHTDVGAADRNKGFAKIKSAEEKADYQARCVSITIPPGHMLVFYERLVHEVRAVRATQRVVRMMLGWRVTDADEPLFGHTLTTEWIQTQAVPQIKSAQRPRVFPTCYTNFPAGTKRRRDEDELPPPMNLHKLQEWSEDVFNRTCLKHLMVGSGPYRGSWWHRIDANMDSLAGYKLPLHRAYDEDEIRLLAPQTWWKLYTFDSPNERVTLRLGA
jgi:hypothetical protein